MKALFKIIAFVLPMLMFSQKNDSINQVVKITAEKILKERKSIDSLKLLKAKEIEKQTALLKKIRLKIEQLKSSKSIQIGDDFSIVQEVEALNALKPNSDVVFWEESRRKWLGRMITGEETKIRMFRFENGRKVYLN